MGPLPAAVYWRRRWVAIASATTLIVLLACGIAALVGNGPDEPESDRPASRAALSAPQETSPPPVAPPLAASPSTPPPHATRSPATSQPGAAGSTPPTPVTQEPAEVMTSSDPTASEGVPPTSSEAPSPTPEPAADPVPCTNGMIAVKAEVDGAEHPVGERMLLRLVVANSSDQPCVRDLDPARQEIVVWSADGSDRLWSSNDCSPVHRADPRTLAPGESLAFSVQWAGRTSAPGCPAKRETVPAGAYRLLTRVDDVISPPTQFVRTP